ncbi:retention module-containing protein, partial [Guyparkeria sp. 1SP6A2]|nr:retention module-containing protein [Guyparkeria sp. 1SP6A2]
MAEAIAVVLEVEGDVWARDADGDMRLLRAGDSVYAGETVVTAQDARVNLDLSNGDTVQLASGQSLLISAEMLAEAEPSSDEQAVTDPGVEEVLALLEGDGDILEQLEDPAAGTTGGSEGGGRTIVEVTRIVEQIDPLAFNFAGPAREPNEPTPGVTGLAEAQAADEPAAPTAPEEPGTPEQTTPSITVNLDDQNGQSVFESLISGTTTNVEPGQTVAIEVTDGESTVTTSAIVQPDGSYQVIEDLSSLSDGELTATATVSDQAGNEATDTDTALLDTEASATITIHTIAGDDVINEEESGETITITGSVGGDAGEGDTVTLTIWGQTFSGTVDGDNNYAIDVPGSLLASGGFIDFRNPDFREGQNPDFGNGDFPLPVPEGGLVQASVSGSDAAGNPYSASTSRPYQVDTFAGAEISIDTIAGDDVINEDESGETITITGSVYGDASEGDTVTLTVGGETFEGTVDGDNNYAIEVPGSQLADNSQLSATVVGTDDAGNPFSADTAREYAVDTEAAATITINTIAGDDIVNAEEADGNISITGSVGGDAAEGDTVTLTVGGQTYTGEVDGINNYAIDVPGTQLAANDQVGASVSGSDDAGNAFSISTSRPYAVDTVAEAGTVTVDDITNDDVINAAESGQTISVTGTATGGDISAGDDVSVTINGTAYGTAVENDGSWSVDVAGSDLAADSAFDVTVDSTDDAGNTVTTTGSSTHGV